MCAWQLASAAAPFGAAFEQSPATRRAAATSTDIPVASPSELDRAPIRVVRDPYSLFTAVTVDVVRNEIIASDENFLRLTVYDRLANTPPNAILTEPKRVIGGDPDHPKDSVIQYPCGIYVDPKNGDVYSLTNDIGQAMSVFPHEANGNAAPMRKLRIPISTFGIAVDETNQEAFITVQHPVAVLVFRKMAKGTEAPVRIVEGEHTQLADPHGIAVDTANNLMFVSNYGDVSYGVGNNGQYYSLMSTSLEGNIRHWTILDSAGQRKNMAPGSGKFSPPSINVYPLHANGDTAPLRVIQGSKTQLNWPGHITLDAEHGELFVANDVGDSVLVFRTADNGDAAPVRVLKGPRTGIKNPTGVSVDTKNDEIVIANMGSHSIAVFPRTASGDVAPRRVIRSGPPNAGSPMLVKPGGIGYDTKRDEILVPN